MNSTPLLRRAVAVVIGLSLLGGLLTLSGCRKTPATTKVVDVGSASSTTDPNTLELVFTYGSEKKEWVNEATEKFNAQKNKSSSGKVIVVKALPMGSGDCVDEVLTEQRKAHLISPASGAYIALGNARSQADKKGDLVEKPKMWCSRRW